MVSAKWCCENINSGSFKFKSVIEEMDELIHARNLAEVREEFGDVLYFLYCWLYSNFRVNLPMVGAMGSVKKFTKRLTIWEIIFEINGLEFHPKYLVNGSNYEKIEKVDMALKLAREAQEKHVL